MNILKTLRNSRRTSGFTVLRAMIPCILSLFPMSGLRRGKNGNPQMLNPVLANKSSPFKQDLRHLETTPGVSISVESMFEVEKCRILHPRVFLRSNLNTREFNSRENYRVFGHNSESSGAFLTKIGGNDSYRPPGPL